MKTNIGLLFFIQLHWQSYQVAHLFQVNSASETSFCTYQFSIPGADDGQSISSIIIQINAPDNQTINAKDLVISHCQGLFLIFSKL